MLEDKLASEIGFEADTTMASTGHAPCDNVETHPPPISSAIQAPCNNAKLRRPAMVGPPAMRWIPIMPHGKFLALGDAAVANKIGSHTQLMLDQIRSQTVLGTTSETLQKGNVCPPNIYSGGNNYYENMSGENALGKDFEVSKIACGENEKDKIMPVESSVHHSEIGEHIQLEREEGLNKTPQQKPKRKKIRPKVIREDKPVRTPKSETIPATKKQKNRSETPAKTNTSETPATKKQINTSETTATKKQINSSETPTTTTPPNHSVTRTYVRRKKLQQSSDVPTSSSGEILDLENESGRKAVKRRLYFNSTEPQARDESQGSKLMYTSIEAQVHDVSLSSNVPSSNIKSAENREKSAEGSTFSLDTLMNQMPTVNILPPKTPIPASHPSKRRSTRVNTELVGNKRAARAPPSLLQPSRRELIRENLKELSKKNGFLQVSGNSEKSTVTTQLDSTMTSDVLFRGIKRGYSLVGENSIPGYRGFMCTSDSDRMGYITGTNGYSHGPHFPKIYKKKRTQKGMKLMPNHSLQGTCSGSSNSSSSNSGSSNWRTNQFLVAFETQRAFWMQRVLFNQRETKLQNTLDLPAQTSSLISPGESVPSKLSEISNITCNQFSAPEMDNTQRSKNYVRQYSYLNWKTKKRTKKEHIRLARSGSSYTNQISLQEHQAASFSYGFYGKRSVHITAEISEKSKYKNPSLRVANTVQEPFCGRRAKEPFCGIPAASQRVRYEDLLDLIILRMKHLNLYEINVINTAATQNALVPYNAGGGMLIPYGQLNLAKKQRPRPKVDLDPETNRVWNLLMGKESEEHKVDAEKEKWWEEERKVVRGRVDSFIARMHLVQGDRRFSKWKGSVVDSVVGVFLTQNVSDHLSSSAFMALAAKYPCRPKVNTNTCDLEMSSTSVVQQEMSSIYSDENLKCQEKMLDQELCYQVTLEEEPVADKEMANNNESFGSNNGTIVLDYSNDKDTDFHVKESEVGQQSPDSMTSIAVEVTSMTSIAAGVTENIGALESSVTLSQNSSEYIVQSIDPKKSVPLVGMEDLISDDLHLIDSSTPFMELLQMQGSTSFKKLYNNVSGSIPPAEYCDTTDQMAYTSVQQDKYNLMGVSYAPSTSYKLQSCSMPSAASSINTTYNDVIGRPASESSGEGTNHQMLSTTSRTSPPIDTYEQLSNQLMQPLTCSETLISKEGSESSNLQSGQTARLQQKEVAEKIQVEITEDAAKIQDQTWNGGVPETYLNLNKDLAETVEVVEGLKSTTEDDVHSVKNDSTSTKKHASKPSKAKTETKYENFDWDKLRRQACPNGTKVERSSDTMDSLDWDALRCADVDEISETIRDRGMNNVLSSRIKAFLNRLVKDHGSIDLEWLRDVPPESAKDYILSIRGLGLKSAECVRLLTLHQLAFPVDTNVGRICVRLGWVPLQPLPESLQLHLLELYPVLETIQKYLWPRLCKLDQQTLYELHYQMITFGKVFCTKRQPNCNACPMRAECRHFASAFTSARLLLTGPEEKGLVNTTFPNTPGTSQTPETCQTPVCTQKVVPQLEGIPSSRETTVCEPIIEEPSTPEPEPETVEDLIREIEDDFREDSEGSPRVREIEDDSHVDSEEIPHIRLDLETLTQNIQDYMQTNKMEVADGEMSNALVVLTQEAASIPVPKLKNQRRLRTEHLVYELPDSHPLLEGYDPREPDDPSPYLLAIWSPGETAHSFEPTKTRCDSQNGELCENSTCFACNGIREARSQTVRGTLLIPCRTANKGSFPLNGTYFQVNEVFAEHESSLNPLVVPRQWLGNLRRRTVFFGTSTTSIFKGLTTDEIMLCFWKGYVCIRGVERKTGFPRPLYARLHLAASKAKNVKAAAEAAEAAAAMAAAAAATSMSGRM